MVIVLERAIRPLRFPLHKDNLLQHRLFQCRKLQFTAVRCSEDSNCSLSQLQRIQDQLAKIVMCSSRRHSPSCAADSYTGFLHAERVRFKMAMTIFNVRVYPSIPREAAQALRRWSCSSIFSSTPGLNSVSVLLLLQLPLSGTVFLQTFNDNESSF